MRVVAVVDAPEEVVAVQVLGLRVELQVVVAEAHRTEAQHHCL